MAVDLTAIGHCVRVVREPSEEEVSWAGRPLIRVLSQMVHFSISSLSYDDGLSVWCVFDVVD